MRPPALARWLWSRLAPERVEADVLGDLDEEYEKYQYGERGPLGAQLWYWYQVVTTLIVLRTKYRKAPRRTGRREEDGIWEGMMTSLGQDIRYTLRTLGRAPGFTIVAIATLALGIGANSAIFSVVDAVLLAPLPYDEPHELIVIGGRANGSTSEILRVSGPEYVDYLDGASSVRDFGAAYVIDANVTNGERPERLAVALVTTDFFPLLRRAPALGRDFEPADAGVDIGYVMILSHGVWQRMYGGDPAVIGQTVLVDEDPITVIGVMPEGFAHPAQSLSAPIDAWVPFDPTSATFGSRRSRPLDVYGRLAEGVTVAESQAEFQSIAQGLRELYPGVYPARNEWDIGVVPLLEQVVGDVRAILLVLFGSVGLVLLVACTNVANLVLTRGSTRTREIAIRAALGGGRLRLARQMLIESLVLGVAGGVLGLLVAGVGAEALREMAAADFPRVRLATIDGSVLLFTLVISVTASVGFGLMPTLQLSRPDFRRALAESGRGSSAPRSRVRDGLVIAQIALSLVLVISAALMVKSFARLLSVDPGFDAERVLAMQVWLPRPNIPENGRFFRQEQRIELFDSVIESTEALPGVERAAVVSHLPLRAVSSNTFELEGMDLGSRMESPRAEWRRVSSGYFDVMGIEVTRGRAIRPSDDREADVPVALVDQAFADAYSPEADPVGRRLRASPESPWVEVVGIVSDVRHQALDVSPRPTIYMPYRLGVGRTMTFVLKTRGPPEAMAQRATETLQQVDGDLPVFAIAAMEDVVADTVAQRRMLMMLLSLFAVQALILAALGVYGVIAYSTRQRTREIGIRIALGADRSTVVGMILRQGLQLGLVGVAIGLAGAAATTRVLQGFLYQVESLDPLVFAAMALLWLGVAGFAAWLPARRGTRVRPAEVLAAE